MAPDLRVGDRERAAAADRLGTHAAAGRLSVEELERRLELVHQAVYDRDLAAVEGDLPSARRSSRPRRPRGAAPIALVLVVVGIVASILVHRPLVPLFVLAFILWRVGWRFGPRLYLAGPRP
jgi:Domain of unknown function (DUF1707)